MNLVLFDLGGTLIDDPFEDVLQMIRPDVIASFKRWKLEEEVAEQFLSLWRDVNIRSDHPFSSHFLQEELWPAEALLSISHSHHELPVDQIPLLALTLLKRYRELASFQIGRQPQLATLREMLAWLKSTGATVGVASNDREFATRTMLVWSRLEEYMEWVFTSEGLSKNHPGAEKPSPGFFRAVFAELRRPLDMWNRVVYVGDSERNDVIPAKAMGIRTLRLVNAGNRNDTSWLDTTTETQADYHCSTRDQMRQVLEEALMGPNKGNAIAG